MHWGKSGDIAVSGAQILRTDSEPLDLIPPDRARIAAVLEPFVARRYPAESPEWRDIAARVARRQRYHFWRKRLGLPRKSGGRSQSEVLEEYSEKWPSRPWPRMRDPLPDERTVRAVWGREGLIIRLWGLQRAQLLLLSSVIEKLKPRSVLEVGAGNGINLFVLSALHPGIKWRGVELTEGGVAVARSVQRGPDLPQDLQDFVPGPIASATAYRDIDFSQGNALALPFADRAFDLVFTFLALEQMQAIRDQSLSEIARVTGRHAAFVEPFSEANTSRTQQHYLRHRGYLNLSVAELPKFGLDPIAAFDDVPQKLTIGASLVVCARKD